MNLFRRIRETEIENNSASLLVGSFYSSAGAPNLFPIYQPTKATYLPTTYQSLTRPKFYQSHNTQLIHHITKSLSLSLSLSTAVPTHPTQQLYLRQAPRILISCVARLSACRISKTDFVPTNLTYLSRQRRQSIHSPSDSFMCVLKSLSCLFVCFFRGVFLMLIYSKCSKCHAMLPTAVPTLPYRKSKEVRPRRDVRVRAIYVCGP